MVKKLTKLEQYIGALRAAKRVVNNKTLYSDLDELQEKIEKGQITWRDGLGGRDQFKQDGNES